MIFWILVAVVVITAVIVFIVAGRRYGYFDVPDAIGALFFTLSVGAVILCIYCMVVSATVGSSKNAQRVKSTTTYELQALDNTENERGKYTSVFLVASGSWDTEQVFRYLYKDEKGAFRLDKIDAGDAWIYEKDIDTPTLMIKEYEAYDDSKFWVPWDRAMSWGDTHEFTVPTGTVVNNYDVGLD